MDLESIVYLAIAAFGIVGWLSLRKTTVIIPNDSAAEEARKKLDAEINALTKQIQEIKIEKANKQEGAKDATPEEVEQYYRNKFTTKPD